MPAHEEKAIIAFHRAAATRSASIPAGVLILLSLLLSGCGLPSAQPSLNAPTVPSGADPTSSGIFSFQNDPQAVPEDFFGFEIYYKFYRDDTGIQYRQDSTTLSTAETGPSQLLNLQYRRAYLYPPNYQGQQISQPTIPLIPVSDSTLKTSPFIVTIDFRNNVSPKASAYYPVVAINGTNLTIQVGSQSSPLRIARYFADPAEPLGSGKYVVEGFGTGDFAYDQGMDNGMSPPGDIATSLITEANNSPGGTMQMIIGLYAIAYGLVNLTTPIYSQPIPIGYLTFNASFSAKTTTQ